jgi:hypothetical protein
MINMRQLLKEALTKLQSYIQQIDWRLLVFLILFLNVKLFIKVVATILIYILRPNLKLGFSFRSSKLPLFYIAMISITLVNWALNKGFVSIHYSAVCLLGIIYWALAILAIHQIRLSINTNDTEKIHNTVLTFFVLNVSISLLQYAFFAFKTGTINLYQYQGEFQHYFMGTGDLIRGISFDMSTTNSMINAFGVVYFLFRKNIPLTILCMAGLLMTGSNFTNLFVVLILLYLFIFKSNRVQKSVISICLFLFVLFIGNISPQNNKYIAVVFESLFQIQSPPTKPGIPTIHSATPPTIRIFSEEEKKQQIAKQYLDSLELAYQAMKRQTTNSRVTNVPPNLNILKPDNQAVTHQRKLDTTETQKKLLKEAQDPINLPFKVMATQPDYLAKIPGKLIAFSQTMDFFKENPAKLVTGLGTGNFSSKLAYRATALHIAGSYPEKLKYISPYFQANHFSLYLYYFGKDAELHSLTNAPNSTFDQILSEYGIIGFFAFIFLYLLFFLKHFKKLTYGIPLILLLLAAFLMDYWYEQLSIVILFELLLLLNIKESQVAEKEKI